MPKKYIVVILIAALVLGMLAFWAAGKLADRVAGVALYDPVEAPHLVIDPPGQRIQWIRADCTPVGGYVYVPELTDPYVKGRVPEALRRSITGPVGAIGAMSVDSARWYTRDADGATRVSSSSPCHTPPGPDRQLEARR